MENRTTLSCPACGGGRYPCRPGGDPDRRYHTCKDCGHKGASQFWQHTTTRPRRSLGIADRDEAKRKAARDHWWRQRGFPNGEPTPEEREAKRAAQKEARRLAHRDRERARRARTAPEREAERLAKLEAARLAQQQKAEEKRIAKERREAERAAKRAAPKRAPVERKPSPRVEREAKPPKVKLPKPIKVPTVPVREEFLSVAVPQTRQVARKRLEDLRMMRELGIDSIA